MQFIVFPLNESPIDAHENITEKIYDCQYPNQPYDALIPFYLALLRQSPINCKLVKVVRDGE